MRWRNADLRRRVNGNLDLRFDREGLTSYAGFELVRRYLSSLGIIALLRRELSAALPPSCVFRSTWAAIPLAPGHVFRSTWAVPERSDAFDVPSERSDAWMISSCSSLPCLEFPFLSSS